MYLFYELQNNRKKANPWGVLLRFLWSCFECNKRKHSFQRSSLNQILWNHNHGSLPYLLTCWWIYVSWKPFAERASLTISTIQKMGQRLSRQFNLKLLFSSTTLRYWLQHKTWYITPFLQYIYIYCVELVSKTCKIPLNQRSVCTEIQIQNNANWTIPLGCC